MFRVLYAINTKNEQTLFTVSPVMSSAKALASMAVCEANCKVIANDIAAHSQETYDKLQISTQTLQQNYPLFTTSLLNLIKNSESALNK